LPLWNTVRLSLPAPAVPYRDTLAASTRAAHALAPSEAGIEEAEKLPGVTVFRAGTALRDG